MTIWAQLGDTRGRFRASRAFVFGHPAVKLLRPEAAREAAPTGAAGHALLAATGFAERTNQLPKLFFSSTLDETPWRNWDNARPLNGTLSAEVAKLKRESGDDMLIYGIGSIVQALTRLGAIDENRLIVNPVILGAGRPSSMRSTDAT